MAFSVMQKMMGGLRNAAENFAQRRGGDHLSKAARRASEPAVAQAQAHLNFLHQYGGAYKAGREAGTTTRGGRRAFRNAQEQAQNKGFRLEARGDRNAEEVVSQLRVARGVGPIGRRERYGKAWTKDGYRDIVKPARVTTGNRPFQVPKPEDGQMMHLPGYGTSSAASNAAELRAANRAKRQGAGGSGAGGTAKASSSTFGGGSQLLANAGAGALAGGVVGGLNPMGDDGMVTGAVKGAALGGLMGAAAGHFGKNATGGIGRGNNALAMGGGRAGILSNSDAGMSSYTASMATLGGAAGGLIGGSGKKKRNTVIQSNSWSQGTHPQYFGG